MVIVIVVVAAFMIVIVIVVVIVVVTVVVVVVIVVVVIAIVIVFVVTIVIVNVIVIVIVIAHVILLVIIVIVFVPVVLVLVLMIVRGGRILRGGNISLWEISYFKRVRNFPLNFQATVRNKPGAKFSHWGAFSLPLCSLAFAFELLSVGRGWRWPRNPDSLPGWRVSIRPQSTRTSRGGGKAPGTQGSGSGIKESQIIRELVFTVPQSR